MTIEELQEALLQEQEKLKILQAQYDESKAKNKELEESNKKLIDYNNKLFMRVTKPSEEKTEEPTAEDAEAELMKDISNLMKERRN